MTGLGKIIGIGAACSACFVVPAIIAALGGISLTSAGIGPGAGLFNFETALCLGIPTLLIVGGYFLIRSRKKAEQAACAVDNSCGCSPQAKAGL